jgi:hypothetical protein
MGFLMKRFYKAILIIFLLFNLSTFTDMSYADDSGGSGEGYILLNLHWSEGEISVNSFKKVSGFSKKCLKVIAHQPYFYTLLDENGEIITADCFKIPKKLFYDYFDESIGELTGGKLQRDECDFVVRVPYNFKAKQITFYKGNMPSSTMNSQKLFDQSNEYELLGTVNF